MAADFGAEYVVVHFPTPDSTNHGGVGYEKLRQIAWQSASCLAEMGQEHELAVHMEGFGPSPFLNLDFLLEVNATFPNLSYCFDTGHMHIAAQRDGFDLYEFASMLAPCIGSIHLWNNRDIDDYFAFGHIPVHPSQDPGEGWVDVGRVLRLILSQSPACRIILESGFRYPQALGGHDFREGVKWAKELVAGLS